jgi:hypothetical protein
MKHARSALIALVCTAAMLSSLCAHVCSVQAQEAPVYVLTASDWNVPRTTEAILHMPALQHTLQDYDKHPNAKIQIHYPGGDEGTLWAAELRSWLVSLGVASKHIELLPGSRKDGQLELQVMTPMQE